MLDMSNTTTPYAGGRRGVGAEVVVLCLRQPALPMHYTSTLKTVKSISIPSYARKSASQAFLSGTQFTLHATCRTR